MRIATMIKTTLRLIRQFRYVLLLAAMLVICFSTASYSAEPSEAIFYTKSSYEGTATTYKIGDSYQADCSDDNDSINDKYLSFELGSQAKVVAWEQCNNTGIKDEWEESKPDISDIESLSSFQVTNSTDTVLTFRLVDDTNSKIPLTLYIQPFGIPSDKPIEDSTDDGKDDYRIIGILPTNKDDESNVTVINLRNKEGELLSTSSVYFQWNAKENKAEYSTNPETAPKGFKIEQTSTNTFDFRWVGL